MKEKTKKKGKKKVWIIIVLLVAALLAAVASQGYNIYMGTFTFGRTTVETTAPGEYTNEGTTFTLYGKLNSPTSKKGTIERVDYTTDVYEDGVTYSKYCNVYLPYGYDPNDTQTKYNVLYFQHGNTADPEIFTASRTKNWLDNLFASGDVEPTILVFTTFYMDVTKDVAERQRSGNVPAGDNGWDGKPGNFPREYIEDIIPAVESRYHTYTERFDEEGLKASRSHRGMSGYSRGGMFTWRMFHEYLEYFEWWSPMSAGNTAGGGMGMGANEAAAYLYLKEAIDAHPNLDFFIYVASGGEADGVGQSLRAQIPYLENQKEFSYGTDPTVNNLCYTVGPGFKHSDLYVPYYYYNTLQVLFH
ncbi:MAG: hypothetical protein IJ865_03685 [Clostridia bacterium]|nr:hypothetical protein [Clostridia bacterium]